MKNHESLDVNAFRDLPAATVITTTEGNIVFANTSFEEMTGYSSAQLMKSNIADLVFEDDVPVYRQFTSQLSNGYTKVQFNLRLSLYRGVVPVAYTASFLGCKSKKENHIMVQGIQLPGYPATPSKENNELAEFAYIVSHDLKAPLRAIVNLADWINEDLKDIENDELKENLRLMKGRVGRMEKLIDGVLQYSRVNRGLQVCEEVNVAEVFKQSIEALAVPPDFQICVPAALPEVTYSKKDLEKIFTNLISNSIRYHDKSQGIIQLDYMEKDGAHVFSISDDGPGIDPEFHEKIFKIFQTLQPRDTLDTSGVGLTIAKKIVEGRGGSITVESARGKGSKFIFTIPKQASNSISL